MGIPFDLKLDTSNDLSLSSGDLTLTTTATEMCVQTLGITLNTYQGEWFMNSLFGIPYLQEIIGVARKKDTVDKIFLAAIADNDYVDSIDSYTSSFDRDDRYYTMTVTVVVAEQTVSTTFSTRPSQEFIYPTPSTSSNVTCSKYILEPYAGELYYFENRDGYPLDTYSTWWNEWSKSTDTTPTFVTTNSGETILTDDNKYIHARS